MASWAQRQADAKGEIKGRATATDVSLADIRAEVQAVANATQSEAYRFEDGEDGSRVRISAAPEPAGQFESADVLPDAGEDVEGLLVSAGDELLRCYRTDDGFEWREADEPYVERVGTDDQVSITVVQPTLGDSGPTPPATD